MLSVEKVATPLTAAIGPPPVSVPPPGFVPIARVTFPVNVVAVFPAASSAVTRTAGVIAAPAGVLLGGAVNASCVAAPAVPLAVKVTGLPVTPDGEAVAVRVFVPTVWLSVQLPTVAMPLPLVV